MQLDKDENDDFGLALVFDYMKIILAAKNINVGNRLHETVNGIAKLFCVRNSDINTGYVHVHSP